jgi:hypothetical protein
MRYRVLMWSGRAVGRSSGALAGAEVARSVYTLRTEAKDERTSTVAIDGGRVTSAVVEPPQKPEGRVPILDEHKSGVVDPLAGLIVGAVRAANARADPCQGRLPVFTGFNRFDLGFAAAPEAKTAAAAGSAGAGRTVARSCQVRVTPIAGHKQDSTAARMLASSKDIRVGFRGPDANGLMLPDTLSVPLWLGTIQVERVKAR